MLDKIELYTVSQFEDFIHQAENQDRLFELINGEIVKKSLAEEHGIIAINIGSEIRFHLRQNKLPGHVGAEVRHRPPNDKHNSRLPDVMYHADISQPVVTQGAVPRMPDLAIEIQSPDDSLRDLREKARFYLANASKLVWLILAPKRLVEVYSKDEELILKASDTLSGGEVLPEFNLTVNDIFPEAQEE